jgi:ribonuclease HI
VPGTPQSNQIAEIVAVIAAANSIPSFWPLIIILDSKYTINGLTTLLGTWEDNGWIGIKNAPYFKKAAYLLKRRTATTTFKWVKGHEGTIGNEESDHLAKEGARKEELDILELDVPKEFDLQGAKLATLTQATAYQGI